MKIKHIVRQNHVLACLTICAVVSGCASVSRGMGKITANKYAEARSGTVWVVPPPQLEPPRSGEKNVYISYRNISDAQQIQLLDSITQPFFLGAGLFQIAFGMGQVALRLKPAFPAGRQLFQHIMMCGRTVKKGDMGGHIQQAAPFKLALNFNKHVANLSQQGGRHRHVIDAG